MTFKNDEVELVELGQFIRDVFPKVIVNVEWYIIYDKVSEKYLGYRRTIPHNYPHSFKWPDIMIINKKTKKIITCLELDGGIHTKTMFSSTEERDKLYKDIKIPLIVITKLEIETTVFDMVYKKIEKILEC